MNDKLPPKGVYAAIAAAMKDIGPIGKTQTADTGKFKYKYRGIDDVYNAVHPIMARHGIMSRAETLELQTSSTEKIYNGKPTGQFETTVIWSVRYWFFHADGSQLFTDVIGEGKDPGDKASGKAMSYAHRTALCQMFCIPFENMPDTDKTDVEEPDTALRDRVLDMISKATDAKTLAGYEHRAATMVQSDEMTPGACDEICEAIKARRDALS